MTCNLAKDEHFEEEEFEDDDEFPEESLATKPLSPLEECQEELYSLKDEKNAFLGELTEMIMVLNRDGQLKGEGYTTIMNLIETYRSDEPVLEDQE